MEKDMMKTITKKLVFMSKKATLSEQDIFDVAEEAGKTTPEMILEITEKLSEMGIKTEDSTINTVPLDNEDCDDSVKLYLRDIGKIALLTPEEEKLTARK